MLMSEFAANVEATLAPHVLRGARRPDLLRPECLGDILMATARLRPQHPALIWGEQVVTYGELAASSDALGGALAKRGVAAGQVVGLCLPRGADALIAQAGITRSGAAWLPLDAETPVERIKSCLASADARVLVTSRRMLPRLSGLAAPIWVLEDLLAQGELAPPGERAQSSDPAYVIFTSGSTGEPKGITITHRSICHFLRSENERLGVNAEDRVYQGFSLAFDMSFEEIWISYLAGATLWIAPPSVVGDPDLLAQALARERITVLHAVPTLMGLIQDPLPTVRLINLGGEPCPDTLANRWARPGRKLFNTYGPTETSVSATLAELKPDEPVTIGYPLPNYGLAVLDQQHHFLPAGETGELGIFGPGLAIGYVGEAGLTAARFIPNPVAECPEEARLFLTGDLGRIEPGGPVHYLGRTDSQVKIRGLRVELDEIAAALTAQPGVAAAAVAVRHLAGIDQLVGFIVPTPGNPVDLSLLRQALASRLPSYMVPAQVEILDKLPLLASSKPDLRALAAYPLALNVARHESAQPHTEGEKVLYSALVKMFPDAALRPEADFFDDLGGHSLLAARLVSILRADPRFAGTSVQDVYRERKLGKIAQALERQERSRPPSLAPEHAEGRWVRRITCGFAQSVVIPFLVLLHITDWLAPFFVYHYFAETRGAGIVRAVAWSLAVFVLTRLAMFALAIAGKWLAAGRLQAGRYPLWGVTYFRWWLAGKFGELPDAFLLAATPWMPRYLRALGARIGRNVTIDFITLGAPDLLTVEDGASVGTFVNIENARVEGGMLIIGPVILQKNSVVDSYSVLEDNTQVGARAHLGAESALAAGQQIPDDETWEGAPARRMDRPDEDLPPYPRAGRVRQWGEAIFFAAAALVVSVLFFLPTFPAFMLIDYIHAHTLRPGLSSLQTFSILFLLSIPASAVLVFLTLLVTGGLRRLLPAQVAGISSVHSLNFCRKKLMNMIQDSSRRSLHGLYASVYAPIWYRLLGAKVGRNTELSTVEGMVPELLSLGDDSFIADNAMLGEEEQRGGWMILRPTQIGHRSFVGNSAYVADGTVVPDDVLIGVQTRAPRAARMTSGQTWVGSPPMLLPARERLSGFSERLTFRPSRLRRCGRAIVEGLRIVLPLAFVIASGYLTIVLIAPIAETHGWGIHVALALTLAGSVFGIASFLLVVALKWLLVGRYRPGAFPMWTPFVWISEGITSLYESLAVPNFLDALRGTPMLPWALGWLGAETGKGVYLNTTDFTEFDCVRIGDDAELNAWSGAQTHLFEDRVMKIGRVEIGARSSVGARSIILYDTQVGEQAHLGPLTLVAKGECLPARTRWEGSPAVPVRSA
jgi:non-ribosomal peptide synthetase-like protein